MTPLLLLIALVAGLVIGAFAMRLQSAPRIARLETELDHTRQGASEQLSGMRETFAALSADALQRNNEQFMSLADSRMAAFATEARGDLDNRRQAIEALVRPLADSLGKVEGKLAQLESARAAAQGALGQQLRGLADAHDKLRVETGALVAALRQPQTRGRWGELQLRRVIELAGMLPYCDFVEQATLSSDGRTLRPDVIIKLPGDRRVVIDAKAPLSAFLDAYEATDPDSRMTDLRRHAGLLREHVRRLSAKSYWSQLDTAPDFVLLFLPGEHFYNAALEADPTLLEESTNQSVLIATPTTLIALLRTIAYGWQQEKAAESAREIAQLGAEVHERLGVFLGHVQKLGQRLRGAVEAFNDAVGSLERRVLPSARRFADHGAVAGTRELPAVEPVAASAQMVLAGELRELPARRGEVA